MLIAARESFAAAARKRAPTARDYVQNGLVAMWDGIENAGWGVHDASAASIVNLVGGGLNISLNGSFAVNVDNIRFNGGYGIADKHDFTGATGATISVLASYDSATEFNANGWSLGGRQPRLAAYQEDGGWRLSAPSNASAVTPPKLSLQTIPGAICKLDFVWNLNSQEISLYSNGNFVAKSGFSFFLGQMSNHFRMMAYGSASDTNYSVSKGNVYNCAVYSRALTAAEIAANYAIDKARFNLP